MYRKRGSLALAAILTFSLLSGCGGGGGGDSAGGAAPDAAQKESAKPAEDNTPVELTFYSHYLGNFDDYMNVIIGDMVHKKYPNITIKVLEGKDGGPLLDELLTTGEPPDIIYAAQSNAIVLKDKYKAIEDLAPYIKKANMDLSNFEPSSMNAIKSYGTKGEIYGLPFVMSPWALYYNKDIFDKFGVPYPTDGMTWDQLTELAAKVTREDGGTQYKGIVLQMIDKMALQLSLPYVDPKTQKPALQNDGWVQLFQQMKKVWDIPNLFTGAADISAYGNAFDQKKTAAMVPNNNKIPNYVKEEEANGFNWDIAEFPSYPDQMHAYPAVEANTLMMDTASKHKDAVFKVISYLVSDEVQLAMAKTAQMSALTDKKFQTAFGENYPSLKTKHVQSIFKGHPAPLPSVTIYDDDGLKAARNAWKDVLVNKKDINSALRDGAEALQQAIDARKAQ